MSLTATIQTECRNAEAVTAALDAMGLEHRTYSGVIHFTPRGWRYGVRVETASGRLSYDTDEEHRFARGSEQYEAHMGQVGLFLQRYAVEVMRREAVAAGLTILGETTLPDGTIDLEIDDNLVVA